MTMRASGWGMLLVVGIVACAVRNDGDVGSRSEALVSPDAPLDVSMGPRSYNPSAVYVPAAVRTAGLPPLEEQLVVGFDRYTFVEQEPQSPLPSPGFAVIKCPGSTLDCVAGPTVTRQCNFNAEQGSDCATPAHTIPDHVEWLGRPSLASEGLVRTSTAGDHFRNVVYVSLVDTDHNRQTAEKVALTVSNDGGDNFVKTIVVNDNGGCAGGEQDFPTAAFDYTTQPPALWIAWRNKQHSNFGACIQKAWIDDNGDPQLLGTSKGFLGGGPFGYYGDPAGLKILAGDGAVTVVFQVAANQFTPCGSANANGGAFMTWASVTSFNDGGLWTDPAVIATTKDYAWCAEGATGVETGVQRGYREFDAILGPDGQAYAMVTPRQGELRLFMSPLRGVNSNTHGGSLSVNASSWREWCPTPGPGPQSRWANTVFGGGPCPNAAFTAPAIIRPTLGFDTNARLLVSFYRTPSPPQAEKLEFVVEPITAPRAALTQLSDFQDTPIPATFFAPSPFDPTDPMMAIGYGPEDPESTLGVRTTNGLGWQNSIVAAGSLHPFPQGERKLFAFWTQPGFVGGVLGSPQLAVRVRRIDFTP